MIASAHVPAAWSPPVRTACRRIPSQGDQQVLGVPPRSLVVLAGLPGAGKTTLLRRLAAGGTPEVHPLDSEEVAERLRAHAGRLPYRSLRPAVHGLHLLRVLREVHGSALCVLTTDPMTSPLRRLLLRAAAHSRGRSLSVVLVDATEEQARLGQRSRGRALGQRRMARHVARAERVRARLDRTGRMSFVDDVLELPRAAAATLSTVAVVPGELSLSTPRPRGA
jgi:GTPase SAR1 family protein